MAIEPRTLLSILKSELSAQDLPVEGSVDPWMSQQEAASVSLVNAFLKKLQVGMNEQTNSKALAKFLTVNQGCKEWELPAEYSAKTEELLGTVREVIYNFWYDKGQPLVNHHFEILERGALGSGANRLARANSFYAKLFASPLSCSTLSLYRWYCRYISRFPEWGAAEDFRKSYYGEARGDVSARLSFVPKNDEISRTICVEPTLNTYFQLGFGQILERRLARFFGIDLVDQQFKNRALARIGSITDGLSTIDLSSASDSMSLSMLRWLLPRDFMSFLEQLRSPNADIHNLGTTELHMVSTMGNGFTFPLQTMLFSAVVVACMFWRGIPTGVRMRGYRVHPLHAGDLWGVNGDDIVCPSSVTEDVISLLNVLGFQVNHDKTFVKGPFRESCGADFFFGVDIRGVYVKTLDTEQARYAVANQLGRFSTRTGINLSRTIAALLPKRPYFVPPGEDASAGFHVSFNLLRNRRWVNRKQHMLTYTCWVPKPRQYRVSEEDVLSPAGARSLIYNPSGLFVSLLQGSVRSAAIGVREDAVKWRPKRRTVSNWDYAFWRSGWESRDFGLDWGRWESVVSDVLVIVFGNPSG